MIVNVKHISRSQFKRINFYPTSEEPSNKTHAYISIFGNDPDEMPAPKVNKSIWHSGIQLQFDDVNEPYRWLKPLSVKQAISIVQFVTELHELPIPITLIVHCYAGVSRSAGVAKFVNEHLNLGLPHVGGRLFNTTVLDTLYRIVTMSISEQIAQLVEIENEKFISKKS